VNRQKLAEVKYNLQGQLKMKLHKYEVHQKEVGGIPDEFLSGYQLAIKDLGVLVPDWKHESVSNENNPKVFPDEEGGTNDNT